TENGRRPRCIRGDHENAGMSEQTGSRSVGQRHTTEMTPIYIRNAVKLREALVHECVVRRQQLDHAPVLAYLTLEEEFRLTAKGITERHIKIREQIRVRRSRGDVPQIQPLPREIRHERRAA